MRVLAVVALLPFLVTLTVSQDDCTGNKSDIGHCTTETYLDTTLTSTDPPTVSQCYETCRLGVFGDAGDWIVNFTGQPAGYIDDMVGFPCGFSVGRGVGEPNDYSFFMANQDIADIIEGVTQMYGGLHGGSVAAQGTMVCDGHQATWYVN